ncbi:hypothetical protein KY311_02085 [Candidatus Woesearchaeota archaeon]|nr:hypothetical protein [Candidatus Woesearchaeota archaeon]
MSIENHLKTLGWKSRTAMHIVSAIEQGAVYADDFVAFGIPRCTIDRYRQILRLDIPSKYDEKDFISNSDYIRAKRFAEIKECLEAGIYFPKDIAVLIGIRAHSVSNYANLMGLSLPKGKRGRPKGMKYGVKPKPDVDKVIRSGKYMRLDELAKIAGVTKQAVAMYIKNSGQEEKVDAIRKNYLEAVVRNGTATKQEKNLYGRYKNRYFGAVAGCIRTIMYQHAMQRPTPAYLMAMEYEFTAKFCFLPFEKIAMLFEKAYAAIEAGEEIVYSQLERELGMSTSSIQRLLAWSKLPVKPKCRPRTRRTITEDDIEFIKRSLKVQMSYADKSYFMKRHLATVRQRSIRLGAREYSRRYRKIDGKSYYRTASQVFEARDLGFTNAEICALLGISKRAIANIFGHRECIEEKIIRALDTLYPGKKHTKPYL